MEEEEGFEPPQALTPLSVFKTDPFNQTWVFLLVSTLLIILFFNLNVNKKVSFFIKITTIRFKWAINHIVCDFYFHLVKVIRLYTGKYTYNVMNRQICINMFAKISFV